MRDECHARDRIRRPWVTVTAVTFDEKYDAPESTNDMKDSIALMTC